MNDLRKPIVVAGSINMDLVAHARQIPVPGQTVIGTGFDTTPGGKGANQAVAAARLGYPVKMAGMVGDDVFGQALLDNLAHAGVGTEAVARVSGPSGRSPDSDGRERRKFDRGGSRRQRQRWIAQPSTGRPRLIRSAGMVLCQLELPLEHRQPRAGALRRSGRAGDARSGSRRAAARTRSSARLRGSLPTRPRLRFIWAESCSRKKPRSTCWPKDSSGVVLKRGAEGAYVAVAGGKAAWVKPFPVEAVDTVGAGDCFNGAFAVALLEGNDPWAAARFASAAAAISVTRRGAQASMPSRAEVDAFLAARG